ncbi:MAG: AbiV family abortive infection protein [archaeon]|nr:AbiV family abortive infection protein [archaeon]
MELCIENSERFVQDAELIYKNKSYGHALSLAVLAMEEIGKTILFWRVGLGYESFDKKLWEDLFKKHKPKLKRALNQILALSIARNKSAFMKFIERMKGDLNKEKQDGFYVNLKDKHEFVSPSNISRKKAEETIELAKSLMELSKGAGRLTWINWKASMH